MPRPTRRFACLAPSACLIVLSSIRDLLEYFDQVADLVDHAAHCRRILQFTGAVELAQAETADGGTVRFLASDRTANQLDFDGLLCSHIQTPVQTKSSSTVLPRLAATADAVVDLVNASSVARTML